MNTTWDSWSRAATQTNNFSNSSVQYRRLNQDGVCYLCNEHCQTCDGPLQTDCLTCTRFNYMWFQRPKYCSEGCPRGLFSSNPGDWYGEYILETAIVTSTGVGDRTCKPCNSNCRWCRRQADTCLQCKDTHYLLDIRTECRATYVTPGNCSVCTTSGINMCDDVRYNSDKRCVPACPEYFYFPLGRTTAASSMWSVKNIRYQPYTNSSYASESFINGTDNDQSWA